MTNMRNRQTCTIGHLHLILPAVALVNVETFEMACKVVRGPGVHEPGRLSVVVVVGGGGRRVAGALADGLELRVETVPAVACLVSPIAADLKGQSEEGCHLHH